jgi:tetratricopeptide (TPR) repeat protein
VSDWRATGPGLVACLLLVAGGCVSHRTLIESSSAAVELASTPFFPQRQFQCGPAALATVLGASQVEVTPEQLQSQVYLPGRRGSLQIEMQAAPRRFGRLAYRIEPELAAVISELDAGRPVLVLHNYGLPFWPRWHYAVAIGHDPQRDQILLRSGTTRRQVLAAKNFMRAWDNADRWAVVILRPGELPVAADRGRYLEAAAAFEQMATPPHAWSAFDAAVKAWPGEPVAWIGRGTARFREKQFAQAAADYGAALNLDATHSGARNNLAMALLEMGCPAAAKKQIARIDLATLNGTTLETVNDTRRQIDARATTGDDADTCAAAPFLP